MSRRRGVLVVVACLLVGLAVANGLLWRSHAATESEAQAANEATDVALASIPVVLSYTPETVDGDLALGADLLAGAFRSEYVALGASTIAPTAKEQVVTSSAVVTEIGVVDVQDTDTVDLLLFVNQTTSRDGAPPAQTGTRVRVTMERVDGRWLIAALDPV